MGRRDENLAENSGQLKKLSRHLSGIAVLSPGIAAVIRKYPSACAKLQSSPNAT
jgi:hypothetical protein